MNSIKRRVDVQRQVPIPIECEGIKFDEGFRADIIIDIIDRRVTLGLKSVEMTTPTHKKQI